MYKYEQNIKLNSKVVYNVQNTSSFSSVLIFEVTSSVWKNIDVKKYLLGSGRNTVTFEKYMDQLFIF